MKFIKDYFNAERFESLVFAGVGIIALVLAIYFWFGIKELFYKGVALPLVLVALIQLTVGTTVYFRSPKDILMVEAFLQNDPKKIQTAEIPRMEIVMKNFITYRYVEIVLIIVGLMSFLFFTGRPLWKGVGMGLFIQAGIMLSLDYFAEKRGREYIQHLKHCPTKM